eukprot:1181601-Rhodomonas_salina.2
MSARSSSHVRGSRDDRNRKRRCLGHRPGVHPCCHCDSLRASHPEGPVRNATHHCGVGDPVSCFAGRLAWSRPGSVVRHPDHGSRHRNLSQA